MPREGVAGGAGRRPGPPPGPGAAPTGAAGRSRAAGGRSRVPPLLLQRVYDGLYFALLLLGLPVFVFKILTSRRWRAGLRERLGTTPAREGTGPCLWIHGVSVGEVLAARTLVALIAREMPDWEVVLSTTTRAGNEVARRHFPSCRVFYYPLDFSFVTDRVLRRIRPDAVLLMELEIWPNFLLSTSRRGIPVFLVNGRISGKSLRGYRVLQRVIPEPMDRIGLYCVQTDAYAERFRALGVPAGRLFVTGTMKFDTVVADGGKDAEGALAASLGFDPGDWVLVAGSTHGSEEAAVLAAFRAVLDGDPRARLVLAPRHLERLDEVEAAVRDAGLRSRRRTAAPEPGAPVAPVVVLDTMGELAALYAVADVVFVGGSLVPHGGQNPMEPAGLGKPVLTGPHTWNFEEVVEVLAAAGGVEVVADGAALATAVRRLHGDRDEARRRGALAREAVRRGRGATRRILDLVRERLGVAAPASAGGPATGRGLR
jgi:3-deoxy-D-manno-octulosonic-acid transferase